MFKGITLEEFNSVFITEERCRKYLHKLKWRKGYCCKKCGSRESWKGRTSLHARCRECDYDESVTANTVFHKLQVPLRKAFSMVFHITVLKKGISTIELAAIYGVNQKTAWSFKRKVQYSMGKGLPKINARPEIADLFSIDGISISHRPRRMNGLQRITVMVSKGSSKSSKKNLRRMQLVREANEMEPCGLVRGHYVAEGKNIQLWNFKSWLMGVHHHCSEIYLQGYLDEYTFRLIYRHKKDTIWHRLIKQMMRTNP